MPYQVESPHCRSGGMVDAHDSKSCLARGEGSSPSSGTDLSMAKSYAGEEASACFCEGLERLFDDESSRPKSTCRSNRRVSLLAQSENISQKQMRYALSAHFFGCWSKNKNLFSIFPKMPPKNLQLNKENLVSAFNAITQISLTVSF